MQKNQNIKLKLPNNKQYFICNYHFLTNINIKLNQEKI